MTALPESTMTNSPSARLRSACGKLSWIPLST